MVPIEIEDGCEAPYMPGIYRIDLGFLPIECYATALIKYFLPSKPNRYAANTIQYRNNSIPYNGLIYFYDIVQVQWQKCSAHVQTFSS